MTVRIIIAAFALAAAFAFQASATPSWNGAGWYVVADTIGGLFVEKGPYASKEDCDASRPANNEDEDFYCRYLATRPDWDD